MTGEDRIIEVDLEDDEEEVPPFTPICTWSDNEDEHRRAFIISHMGNSEIEGKVLVDNMQRVFEWLKLGAVPKAKEQKKATISRIDNDEGKQS